MKRLLFFILLTPYFSIGQNWLHYEEEYFYAAAGLDVRNAIFGGTVNDAALDGTLATGWRSGNFLVEAYYEHFKVIEYQSFGFNTGFVVRPGKQLVPVADISLSFIKRPWNIYPSIAFNTRMEYHQDRFFVFLRGEYRFRTDYDFFQVSVYGGLGFKFGFSN